MNNFSIISAFIGMKLWNQIIGSRNQYLILVLPDYEESLLEELIPALKWYLSLDSLERVLIVFTDSKVQEVLFCSCSINFEFVQIRKKDMSCLVCYMLLSSKHYGTMRKQNVKLLSFNVLYGNQLRLIADNGLYSQRYMISEEILNRI